VHTKLAGFVTFWVGASLCLAYLATSIVASGVIRLAEDSVTTIARLCLILIFFDLLMLLEFISDPHEEDDEKGR
jgi:hypothetical protein